MGRAGSSCTLKQQGRLPTQGTVRQAAEMQLTVKKIFSKRKEYKFLKNLLGMSGFGFILKF